jgi:hypothetical protein
VIQNFQRKYAQTTQLKHRHRFLHRLRDYRVCRLSVPHSHILHNVRHRRRCHLSCARGLRTGLSAGLSKQDVQGAITDCSVATAPGGTCSRSYPGPGEKWSQCVRFPSVGDDRVPHRSFISRVTRTAVLVHLADVKTKGTIEALKMSPKGFHEGILLRTAKRTVLINLPKDSQTGIELKPGDQISAEGEREPEADPRGNRATVAISKVSLILLSFASLGCGERMCPVWTPLRSSCMGW